MEILTWYHRSASAIVSEPENSSVAYHKEIYTVLFDPPSFIMVSSILRHLWKLSKIEKKFLPLPRIRNSLLASSIQPSSDSILEVEGEISPLPTSVFESISPNDLYSFNFGNLHHFDHDALPSDSAIVIKPEIDGSVIKFGNIECLLTSFKEETMELDLEFYAARESEAFVTDLVKTYPVDLDSTKSTATSISEISSSCFKDYGDAVSAIRLTESNLCINEFENFVMQIDVSWLAVDTYVASSVIDCNNAVPVTLSPYTVMIFDPSGVVKPLPDTITLISSSPATFRLIIVFFVEFSVEFMVTVFYPGGDVLHHREFSGVNFSRTTSIGIVDYKHYEAIEEFEREKSSESCLKQCVWRLEKLVLQKKRVLNKLFWFSSTFAISESCLPEFCISWMEEE